MPSEDERADDFELPDEREERTVERELLPEELERVARELLPEELERVALEFVP